MSLFARSDLMSVSIPVSSGGCGHTHSRPVAKGVAQRAWELKCPSCESYLRGDGKPKVIKVEGGDKNKGIPSRMNHVADADPHWSTTPETIPPTPDEEKVHSVRAELGKEQLQMINSFAAAKQAGIEIPAEAWWLLERNFDPKILQGQVECALGHSNPAGAKHCMECGTTMVTRGSIGAPEIPRDTELDLNKVHVATLKKMCREQGLSDKGTKAQLIERLS